MRNNIITFLYKSAAILAAVVISSCGYLESKEKLAAWVRQSMQQEAKEDEAYQGLTIGDVALVRESASKFSGYVEFKYGADTEKAALTITADGEQKIYRCEPPRALMMKRDLASAQAAAKSVAKDSEKEECVERQMKSWEIQREQEVSAWCAGLAKKGEECRISAGQDAMVRLEELEKVNAKCQ